MEYEVLMGDVVGMWRACRVVGGTFQSHLTSRKNHHPGFTIALQGCTVLDGMENVQA